MLHGAHRTCPHVSPKSSSDTAVRHHCRMKLKTWKGRIPWRCVCVYSVVHVSALCVFVFACARSLVMPRILPHISNPYYCVVWPKISLYHSNYNYSASTASCWHIDYHVLAQTISSQIHMLQLPCGVHCTVYMSVCMFTYPWISLSLSHTHTHTHTV